MLQNPIQTIDLAAWVASAPNAQRQFRKAVHIVIQAISHSAELNTQMVMKGGMLLALRYGSNRFTRDADFSTTQLFSEVHVNRLISNLGEQLILTNETLEYDVATRLQRHEVRPALKGALFPALALTIGYAPRSNARAFAKLLAGQAIDVVEIDYSYNEAVLDVEILRISDGNNLQVYSQINLMAEKFRSLLQQPIRNRSRRQDIYDLALLIRSAPELDADEKATLLRFFIQSSRSRKIDPTIDSMRNPRVRELAERDYPQLQNELLEPLASFEPEFEFVRAYYESLPWKKLV
jgi:predicted nucleotidyltransferase component of viral defense system